MKGTTLTRKKCTMTRETALELAAELEKDNCKSISKMQFDELCERFPGLRIAISTFSQAWNINYYKKDNKVIVYPVYPIYAFLSEEEADDEKLIAKIIKENNTTEFIRKHGHAFSVEDIENARYEMRFAWDDNNVVDSTIDASGTNDWSMIVKALIKLTNPNRGTPWVDWKEAY